MANCWDEEAQELVHKGHCATGITWKEIQGTSEITWEKYKCQCGNHTHDVFQSARELPKE